MIQLHRGFREMAEYYYVPEEKLIFRLVITTKGLGSPEKTPNLAVVKLTLA